MPRIVQTNDEQYKKMTETPIPNLILQLGIPTIISMLVTNIYNMADTYFVGTVGTSASGNRNCVAFIHSISYNCIAQYQINNMRG